MLGVLMKRAGCSLRAVVWGILQLGHSRILEGATCCHSVVMFVGTSDRLVVLVL